MDHRCPLAPGGAFLADMDVLGFATLAVGGFTACAEFGSYAFVHPVIRRLPPEHHLQVEQGLLRTFGRVMPVLMTLTLALAVADGVHAGGRGGPAGWRWAAARGVYRGAHLDRDLQRPHQPGHRPLGSA